MPGSVPPTKRHCDADYYHDASELNFWVPLWLGLGFDPNINPNP